MPDLPRRWNPVEVAPPLGSYSHLAEAPHGHRLVFISGQIGNALDGSLAGDDIEAQTSQALANIESLLRAAGASPANLLRLQSFLVGTDSIPGFRRALTSAYAGWFPDSAQGFPGHSLLVVQALANSVLLVEIEGWFTLPPEPDAVDA